MKTIAEILKESGLTDEQIKAIDAKAVQALTTYADTANQTLEAADLAKRAQQEQYDKEIAPALDKWANDSASLAAQRDYYKTLAEKAKEGGFIPGDAPFTPPTVAAGSPVKGPDGKFVANSGATPGSPQFDPEPLRRELGTAFAFAADTQWKYRSLFNRELPDSPTALIREATANRMSPQDWAAKKYGFAEREGKIKEEQQKAHDDKIRQEAMAESDRKWSEKVGSNPDLNIARESSFTALSKATQTGQRKDPLKMSPEERKSNTHQTISKEIAEHTETVH